MLKSFQKFRWIILAVGFVFLLVFGLVLIFDKSFAERFIVAITGLIIITIGVIRFFPLLKTLHNKKQIIINTLEIIINIILGIIMIAIAFNNQEMMNKYMWLYKYIIVAVLGLRGLIYLIEIAFLEEKAEIYKFVIHIGFVIFASALATYEKFDLQTMITVFIVLCFLASLYCLVDGIINYNNYRKNYLPKKVHKEKEAPKEKEENAEVEEEIILDIVKEEDDRPYVN